jgi:hypothetical protein
MAELKKECATCKNWMPGKTDEAMRKHWLALCRFEARYVFLPPQGSCARYTAASPTAVAARAGWLSSMVGRTDAKP